MLCVWKQIYTFPLLEFTNKPIDLLISKLSSTGTHAIQFTYAADDLCRLDITPAVLIVLTSG